MKKILTVVLILMVAALSACSASTTQAVSQSAATEAVAAAATDAVAAQGSISGLDATYTDAVSVEEQLIYGTLNLDGTDQKVTKDQAASLITLYTSLQTLTQQNMPAQGGGKNDPNSTPAATQSADNSAAQPQAMPTVDQTQVDALVTQIEAVMTADQLSAISAMQITRTSAATILQAKGITAQSAAGDQGGNGAPQANGDANGTGNGQQGGNPPSADGTPDASGQGGQGQPGGNGQMGGGSMIQPQVMSALIQYLANIAGVEVPTTAAPAAN
jgi:hypothetical protein